MDGSFQFFPDVGKEKRYPVYLTWQKHVSDYNNKCAYIHVLSCLQRGKAIQGRGLSKYINYAPIVLRGPRISPAVGYPFPYIMEKVFL